MLKFSESDVQTQPGNPYATQLSTILNMQQHEFMHLMGLFISWTPTSAGMACWGLF
jgi:hypothetical protein